MFIGTLFLMYGPAKKLSRVNANLQQAIAASERIFEMLDTHTEVLEQPGASALTPFQYTITDQESDQTPAGKGSNLLVGTAAQVTDNLKRLKEAGLNLLLIWPPFADVPVSKTLDDLKRLKQEIMPKVDAM